jgi:hypothetical protein
MVLEPCLNEINLFDIAIKPGLKANDIALCLFRQIEGGKALAM